MKQFGNFEGNLVRKEDISVEPKIEDEIQPYLSQLDRERYEKGTGQEMTPKDFNVWIVETEASRTRGNGHPPLIVSSTERSDDPNDTSRFIHSEYIPQHELQHALANAFIKRGEVAANLLPDLVVVSGGLGYIDNDTSGTMGSELAEKYLEWETGAIRDIRKAADAVLRFPEIETGDPVRDGWAHQFLSSNILGETRVHNQFERQEITDALALENICSVLFVSEADWGIAAKTFDEYVRTGDEELLHRIVTPGRVRKAIESESRFSPKQFTESLRWREKASPEGLKFEDEADALRYYMDSVDHVREVVRNTPPEELQRSIFETLKKLIDQKKGEYLYDVELDAAEHKILQPLIVATGPSELYLNAALEAGADAVLKEASPEDLKKLVALANTIRTSPASIAADRLRRNKNDFYRSVVDQIESRSEQTADTEQEVCLLKALFEKNNAKKILDIGSGYGRLFLPLVESGYDVTGLETNRIFLEKAKKSAGKNRRAHFKKGDLIHYENTVKREEYDAVYYGWHSFLEAYGLGNSLATLRSARMALKPGGTVTFDQPSRENADLEDGWYGDEEHGYLAYLMNEDELKFVLRLAGFENVEITHWVTKPSELYPEGMKKITVTAQKPKFYLPVDTKEKAPSKN